MNLRLIALLLIFSSCGGSLSDEQRHKIKEEMKNSKITRVTDAEITEAAFKKGREIVKTISADTTQIDSLSAANHMKIYKRSVDTISGDAVEEAMIQAYASSPANSLEDNVQKIRSARGELTDSLLYTAPIIVNGKLESIWSIWLSRKQLVLSLSEKR